VCPAHSSSVLDPISVKQNCRERRESALLDTTVNTVTEFEAKNGTFLTSETKLYTIGRMKSKSLLAKRIDRIDSKLASKMSACGHMVYEYRPICGHPTKSRLFSSRHCRHRICPICARVRSMKLLHHFVPAIKKYVEENHLHPYFVTFTLKNTPALPDPKLLKRLYYNVLRQKFFEDYGLDGWFKNREVVIGKGSRQWHVHDHAFMLFRRPIPLIKSGARAGHAQKSVNQALSDCWRKVTGGVSYIVDIKRFDGNYIELVKYMTKSAAYFNDKELAEFLKWQKNQPSLFRGGSLRGNPKINAAIEESENLDKEDDTRKIVCKTCGETRVMKWLYRWQESIGQYVFYKVVPFDNHNHNQERGP
jgi:hypothetical protein